MKKIVIVIISIACILGVTGCTKIKTKENNQTSFKCESTNSDYLKIYVDKETGVNYIVYSGNRSGGMTVRLNADGTPYISDVSLKNK